MGIDLNDIDWPYYILMIVFSCVGFVYFSFGKKMNEFWYMIAGISLMFYGYMCDSWIESLIFGLVLSGIPFLVRYF